MRQRRQALGNFGPRWRLSATVIRITADRWRAPRGALPDRTGGIGASVVRPRTGSLSAACSRQSCAARVRVGVRSGNAVPAEPDAAINRYPGNTRGQFDELTCISDGFPCNAGRVVGSERCLPRKWYGIENRVTTTAHPAWGVPGVVVGDRFRGGARQHSIGGFARRCSGELDELIAAWIWLRASIVGGRRVMRCAEAPPAPACRRRQNPRNRRAEKSSRQTRQHRSRRRRRIRSWSPHPRRIPEGAQGDEMSLADKEIHDLARRLGLLTGLAGVDLQGQRRLGPGPSARGAATGMARFWPVSS